jgi:hypothetical protein
MVAVSIFGLYGAATGRLAAMLAAILAPSLLSQTEQSKSQTEQSKLRANLGVNYPTQRACELVNGKGNCMSATDPKTGKVVWGVNPLKAAPSV